MSEAPVRVLLVDDDDLMRAGLKAVLSSDDAIEVVGEASDGRAAVEQVRASSPGVVLMDVRMPDLDGISATREVLESSPEVKVMILTTFEQDDYIFGALNAGASGFLLKRTSPEELIAGIHTVAVGDSLLSPSVTRRVIDRMASQPAADRPYDERLGRAHAARAGSPGPGRARPLEQRDRGGARDRGVHGEDPREADPHEAPPARPRAGGDLRLRKRAHAGPFSVTRARRAWSATPRGPRATRRARMCAAPARRR